MKVKKKLFNCKLTKKKLRMNTQASECLLPMKISCLNIYNFFIQACICEVCTWPRSECSIAGAGDRPLPSLQ